MKSDNKLYGLEDNPPLFINLLLGVQHVCIIAIGLVFPVILIRTIGGTPEQSRFIVSMSMFAGGIGVIIQALRKGPVGSGFLCPTVCGPSFLAASMLCAKVGGLPLVFGMTMIAGSLEAVFSRVLDRIRVLFPPEITGVIVAMVGISVIRVAGINLLGVDDGVIDKDTTIAGIITLFLMIGLNIWTKGNIKLFCILIGMIFGYILSFVMGILSFSEVKESLGVPLAWFPFAHHPGWSFSWVMIGPVAIAMLCSSLKSIGDLTTCQKINDNKWTRPDISNLKKGILADGVACFSAGLFGGMGQSTSSTNIGLSIATGATSRIIGVSTGIILICLSFFPKLSAVFSIMPAPVIGATLIFALSFMVVAGFQIIMSRMIDSRKTFIIGLSIIFGLMIDIMPDTFNHFPQWIQPIFASSLSASTLLAVTLNMIFRIGIKSTATTEIVCGQDRSTDIFQFFESNGRRWAARGEIVDKAKSAVNEYAELLNRIAPATTINLAVHFDELNLRVEIEHPGEGPQLPDKAPPPALLEADPDMFDHLAGYLIRAYADKVAVTNKNQRTRTLLSFQH